jgi:hypothetical protein
MTVLDSPRDAADKWFLDKGLPAALLPRSRARHLWLRSAPALAAYATVVVALLVVYFLTGSSEIYIDGAPTAAERIVLGVLALAAPLAVAVGRAVSPLPSRHTQSAVAVAAVAVAAVAVATFAGVAQGGFPHLLSSMVTVVVVVVSTATGVGAVLGWAVRLTMTQVAAMGALFVRALPVVLLTVVVFFNTYVWILAATIGRGRLWIALAFLLAVTAVFLVSASHSWAKPMLESVSSPHEAVHDLTDTPFAAMPDAAANEPLTKGERFNIVVVLAAAQIAHLLVVAVCTAAIFFVLGLILLSPAVLAKWTGDGASDGTVLGMTIPVPQSLIHVTLILCALTFMYVSARSVGDAEYKRNFLSPLIEDLHTTLIARNRYRADSRGLAPRTTKRARAAVASVNRPSQDR